jgi:acyl dehydratase
MILVELTLSEVSQYVGKEIGVSGWMTVDQSRINQFAECSGDRQWIHVDVERAKRESPYGAPIAHGYLRMRVGWFHLHIFWPFDTPISTE